MPYGAGSDSNENANGGAHAASDNRGVCNIKQSLILYLKDCIVHT